MFSGVGGTRAVRGPANVKYLGPLITAPFFDSYQQPQLRFADPPPSRFRGPDGHYPQILSPDPPIPRTYVFYIGSRGKTLTSARVAILPESDESMISKSFSQQRELSKRPIMPGQSFSIFTAFGIMYTPDLKISAMNLGIKEDDVGYNVKVLSFDIEGVDMIMGKTMLDKLCYRHHRFGRNFRLDFLDCTVWSDDQPGTNGPYASPRLANYSHSLPENVSYSWPRAINYQDHRPSKPSGLRKVSNMQSGVSVCQTVPRSRPMPLMYTPASVSYETRTQPTSHSSGLVQTEPTSPGCSNGPYSTVHGYLQQLPLPDQNKTLQAGGYRRPNTWNPFNANVQSEPPSIFDFNTADWSSLEPGHASQNAPEHTLSTFSNNQLPSAGMPATQIYEPSQAPFNSPMAASHNFQFSNYALNFEGVSLDGDPRVHQAPGHPEYQENQTTFGFRGQEDPWASLANQHRYQR